MLGRLRRGADATVHISGVLPGRASWLTWATC